MRILGWLAMIVAVVGFVAGLGLAGGVWVVRPSIEDRAAELIAVADVGLGKAIDLTDTTSQLITHASEVVADIGAKADALVASPIIDPATTTALATAIDEFITGPYTEFRGRYAALKERVTTVLETLKVLDRVIPAISLPSGFGDKLKAVDERLTQIDATVTSVAGAVADGLSAPGVAARVSQQAATAGEVLGAIGTAVDNANAAMQEARPKLAVADDKIATLLTAIAGASTIFGLYLAGLNVLLFQQGRRWSRLGSAPPD